MRVPLVLPSRGSLRPRPVPCGKCGPGHNPLPYPPAKVTLAATARPLTGSRKTDGGQAVKMLARYSTCLFSGVCAALVAVALAYYLYW